MAAKGGLLDRVPHDEKDWPIVVVTMPKEALSDEDVRELMTHVTSLIQRGQPFAMVIDVRGSPPITADQRRIMAEAMDRNAARYPESFPVSAVVLETAIQRGIVRVLQWLTRSRQRLEPFTDLPTAVAWAHDQIRQRGSRRKLAAG